MTIITVSLLTFFLIVSLYKCRKHNQMKKGILTNHKIRVFPSKQTNKLNKKLIENWTVSVVDFWCKTKGWNRESILRSLENTQVLLEDDQYYIVNYAGQEPIKAKAFVLVEQRIIRIATDPINRREWSPIQVARSLFKHEISHIIVAFADNKYMSGDAAHNLFKEVNLTD